VIAIIEQVKKDCIVLVLPYLHGLVDNEEEIAFIIKAVKYLKK